MSQSQKLTLFFNDENGDPQVDNGLFRRDLDPEIAPQLDEDGNALWVVGRGKHADIAFGSLAVSRRHAYIRCWAIESRMVWQVKHELNARNPSYKDNRNGVVRLPEQWLNIHDYDQFWFAERKSGFICTTQPNDTMQSYEDTDFGDEGPPTINETMQEAIAKAERPWYADAVHVILTGPRGFPQWLWWLCLLGAGLFVAWLRSQ